MGPCKRCLYENKCLTALTSVASVGTTGNSERPPVTARPASPVARLPCGLYNAQPHKIRHKACNQSECSRNSRGSAAHTRKRKQTLSARCCFSEWAFQGTICRCMLLCTSTFLCRAHETTRCSVNLKKTLYTPEMSHSASAVRCSPHSALSVPVDWGQAPLQHSVAISYARKK